jgi:PPK2 family polyphosphate:nucleotide phosphotransferase
LTYLNMAHGSPQRPAYCSPSRLPETVFVLCSNEFWPLAGTSFAKSEASPAGAQKSVVLGLGARRLRSRLAGTALLTGSHLARKRARKHVKGKDGWRSTQTRPVMRGSDMDYRKKFMVEAGVKVRLAKIDPTYSGKHDSHATAMPEIQKNVERMAKLQYLLYADGSQSLLVVLQAPDAAGKDGVIHHLFTGMNPQGVSVFSFKQPSKSEAAHDFLWRAHLPAPGKGQVAIYNRSYYEDVLVVRVRKLVSRSVWSKRYEQINDFEKILMQNDTRILKFYLHISPQEQLARFKQRLDDPSRHWKISDSDYSERELWPKYIEAYEDALAATSTKRAPWYVIPANHKWFRNLAISHIVADTMDEMGMKLPPTHVDIAEIRRKYHAADIAQQKADGQKSAGQTNSRHG